MYVQLDIVVDLLGESWVQFGTYVKLNSDGHLWPNQGAGGPFSPGLTTLCTFTWHVSSRQVGDMRIK